jgi:hypothetical protein
LVRFKEELVLPNLRLVGKGEEKPKRWKIYLSILIIVLAFVPLGYKWYVYDHSPTYAAEKFVKAIMTGDDKTLNDLNYTTKSTQTLKIKWSEKLKGYDFKDIVITPSSSTAVHVTIQENRDIDLVLEMMIMNGSYFVSYSSI